MNQSCTWILLALSCLCSVASAQASQDVLSSAGHRGIVTPSQLASSLATRGRHVHVDAGLLAGPDSQRVRLRLFDDLEILAEHERRTDVGSGGVVWTGRVAGQPESSVILSVIGDVVMGNIVLPDEGLFQIRYVAPGLHAVYEVDQTRFPYELEPLVPELPAQAETLPPPTAMQSNGSIIDVMVIYTTAARVEVGGTAAMNALVHLAMEETNQSYINSNVNPRLSLVHVAETSYIGAGNIETDLNRLRSRTDGHLDFVHDRRDDYGADLVSLWVSKDEAVEGGGAAVCGIGYLMGSISPVFESSAFSAVSQDCATGYYSFGHEIGHNMSLRHDWFIDDTAAPVTYNHGHTDVAGGRRTVMAYNRRGAAKGRNLTRMMNYSNPHVSWGATPTGVAAGTSSSCSAGINPGSSSDCDAENWLALNNAARTVANFRAASPLASDVWIGDTWLDTGQEPDPRNAAEDMWKSPSIWARKVPDTNLVHQHQHQNPEFGQPNYIYAKLRVGSSPPTDGTLEFYYADASAGLMWAGGGGQWTLFDSVVVSSLTPNTSQIVEAVWSTLPATSGHYCLLARWNSSGDPMTFSETSNIDFNVRRNNNIAWRNINIVDQFDFDSGTAEVTMLVENFSTSSETVDLAIELPGGMSFLDVGGQVWLNLGPQLFGSWLANGAQGNGTLIHTSEPNTVRILDNTSFVNGMTMTAGQSESVEITYVNCDQPGKFDLTIAEYIAGQRVGGVGYQVCLPEPTDGSVNGTVTNQAGAPLAGLVTRLYRFNTATSDWDLVNFTLTADSGGYSFEVLDGTYRVGFSDPLGVYESEYFANAVDLIDAADIVIAGNPAFQIDAVLAQSTSGCTESTYEEDFESYAALSPIEGQGGWQNWDVCATGNQAFNTVSSAQASGGNNSLRMIGSGTSGCVACSDTTHELTGPHSSGQFTLSMDLFIPANFFGEAYIIVMNTYSNCGGPYDWSAQVNIDSTGTVGPDNLHNNVAINGDQPVIYNTWVELMMEIDLDANSVVYSYNGVEMFSADWTTAGVQEIAALSLFPGTDDTTEWFVDSVSLKPCISSAPIGVNYCSSNPNSTGSRSYMSAFGSAVVANNDLTLTASSLPPHSNGFFVTGPASAFVSNPGGSAGNLCIGGGIGRYVAPGQIQNSGPAGEIVLSIDNTAIPTPVGPVAVSAGETRFFQLWHRDSDPSGPTSNFTDGLEITFL